MTSLAWLIPAALFLGALGLAAFLWALRSGQFEDLEGAGWRALEDKPASGSPLDAKEKGKHSPPAQHDAETRDET